MKTRTLFLAKPGIPGSPNYMPFYFWADDERELTARLRADDPIWRGTMFYKPIHSVSSECGALPRKGFVFPRAA